MSHAEPSDRRDTADPVPTRDRIVAAANRLFYRLGIRSVSVDAVAAEAGLTKRSLYYHFSSKDALVAAYLGHRDGPNIARYAKWYDNAEGGVADKVGAVFGGLAQAAARPDWKGCGFLRTAAELVDMPGHPALAVAAGHKKRLEHFFTERFAAAGLHHAEDLARQIAVLIDGGFATAMLHREPGYFLAAGRAAETLVTAAARA